MPTWSSKTEKQVVDIARRFIRHYPHRLMDASTIWLQTRRHDRVIQLVDGAKERGTVIIGFLEDQDVWATVIDRLFYKECRRIAA